MVDTATVSRRFKLLIFIAAFRTERGDRGSSCARWGRAGPAWQEASRRP